MVLKSIIFCLLIFYLLVVSSFATEMRLIDHKYGEKMGDRFGDACEGLGDINGDGYADFLVTSFFSHKLELYLGGPHPFDSLPVLTWENHASLSGLRSFSPVNVGDMDCDGINDFVSDFGDDDTLVLFLGLENLDPDDRYAMFVDTSENWIQYGIGGGGDNNNDGRPDLWVYNQHGIDNDTMWGFWGCDLFDTIVDHKVVISLGPNLKYTTFSQTLCTNCDINGDSIPDIIYGQYSGDVNYQGRVCIIWGNENLPSTSDLVFYAPPSEDDNDFGFNLACLNDINGDGIDDLWVNQKHSNYIYFGGQPFDTIPDYIIDYSGITFGAIANIGDINNDDYNDIILPGPSALYSTISLLYCFPSMDTLVDIVYTDGDYHDVIGPGAVTSVGIDVSWASDIDGDGIDDILISAREDEAEWQDYGLFIIQAGWDGVPNDVEDDIQQIIPDQLEVLQNYPNPFNAGTVIEFTLPRMAFTEVTILNLLGQEVARPLSQILPAGSHTIHWDGNTTNGSPAPSGVYFYHISSGEVSLTKRMILLK